VQRKTKPSIRMLRSQLDDPAKLPYAQTQAARRMQRKICNSSLRQNGSQAPFPSPANWHE